MRARLLGLLLLVLSLAAIFVAVVLWRNYHIPESVRPATIENRYAAQLARMSEYAADFPNTWHDRPSLTQEEFQQLQDIRRKDTELFLPGEILYAGVIIDTGPETREGRPFKDWGSKDGLRLQYSPVSFPLRGRPVVSTGTVEFSDGSSRRIVKYNTTVNRPDDTTTTCELYLDRDKLE